MQLGNKTAWWDLIIRPDKRRAHTTKKMLMHHHFLGGCMTHFCCQNGTVADGLSADGLKANHGMTQTDHRSWVNQMRTPWGQHEEDSRSWAPHEYPPLIQNMATEDPPSIYNHLISFTLSNDVPLYVNVDLFADFPVPRRVWLPKVPPQFVCKCCHIVLLSQCLRQATATASVPPGSQQLKKQWKQQLPSRPAWMIDKKT